MSKAICLVGVLCFLVGCLATASGLHIPNKKSEYGTPLSTFKLKRISHELIDGKHRVQLFLEGDRLPRVYLVKDYETFQPAQLQLQNDGRAEFYQRSNLAIVLFLHPQGYQSLELNLDSLSSEQNFPDVELFVQGGKEITFEQGNNADVNVTFAIDYDQNRIRRTHLFFGFSMRSKTEDHVVRTFHYYPEMVGAPFAVLDRGTTGESQTFTHLRVFTASGDVEGLVELDGTVHFRCPNDEDESCLKGTLIIHEDVPAHRNGGRGPFPAHFLGLMEYAWKETPLVTEQVCSIHRSCRLRCEFIGDHPAPVEFVRVDGLGIPNGYASLSNNGFRAMGYLETRNVTTSGGEVEYQCRSTSGSEVVSHTVKVVFVNDARIRQDLSSVTMLEDGKTVETTSSETSPAAVPSSWPQSSEASQAPQSQIPHGEDLTALMPPPLSQPKPSQSPANPRSQSPGHRPGQPSRGQFARPLPPPPLPPHLAQTSHIPSPWSAQPGQHQKSGPEPPRPPKSPWPPRSSQLDQDQSSHPFPPRGARSPATPWSHPPPPRSTPPPQHQHPHPHHPPQRNAPALPEPAPHPSAPRSLNQSGQQRSLPVPAPPPHPHPSGSVCRQQDQDQGPWGKAADRARAGAEGQGCSQDTTQQYQRFWQSRGVLEQGRERQRSAPQQPPPNRSRHLYGRQHHY